MSHFVIVSSNFTQMLATMDNYSVKLVALSTGAFLKFKRRALKGPIDARTPINAWARLFFAGFHYQPLFGIWSCAPQAKKLSSQGRTSPEPREQWKMSLMIMPGLNRVNSDSKIELFCLLLDIFLDKISLVNRNYFVSVLEICLSSFR